ncbi:hypothetical protein [Paraburkholderia hospita]|uniref:hypothetical protein n=1 Tax=Paraburkholderia hospita TaxID=169430 RepID=UPI000271799E|nr:hypothetical protein [Paraburkholderia hospita]EUC14677.1 hypothetical protein PMI06_006503 [Burkholderia sp. BT03]SKC94069.1 hypothetical protein SAMN06266956_5933 [Paraburkholderia hospita]
MNVKRVKYVAPLLATLLIACGGGGDDGAGSASQSVQVQDVTMTFFRSFAPGTYVFRSQSELASAWAAAPFEHYPIGLVTVEPAMPTYDFTKYTVVGLSSGIGKWCFAPRITGATSDGKDLVVHYFVPTTGTLACMFNGPLIAFVLVPQVKGNVQFVQDPAPF